MQPNTSTRCPNNAWIIGYFHRKISRKQKLIEYLDAIHVHQKTEPSKFPSLHLYVCNSRLQMGQTDSSITCFNSKSGCDYSREPEKITKTVLLFTGIRDSNEVRNKKEAFKNQVKVHSQIDHNLRHLDFRLRSRSSERENSIQEEIRTSTMFPTR